MHCKKKEAFSPRKNHKKRDSIQNTLIFKTQALLSLVTIFSYLFSPEVPTSLRIVHTFFFSVGLFSLIHPLQILYLPSKMCTTQASFANCNSNFRSVFLEPLLGVCISLNISSDQINLHVHKRHSCPCITKVSTKHSFL